MTLLRIGTACTLNRAFAVSITSAGVTDRVPATDMPKPCVSTALPRPAA